MQENALKINRDDTNDIFYAVKHLFNDSEEILWICDFETSIFYASDKLKLILGYDTSFPLNSFQHLSDIVFKKDRKQLETLFEELYKGETDKIHISIRFLCFDGEMRTMEIRGSRSTFLKDNDRIQPILSGSFIDINGKKRLENQLNYAVYYDLLTELPNRSLFAYRANVAINQRGADNLAVVLLGLDNFKRINDLYGHDVGDGVLIEISKIIKNEINNQQILSRLGGDGFILLMPVNEYEELIYKQLDSILLAISRPFIVGELEIQLTCSAGIAVFPDNGTTAEELIKNADAAMHKAKEKGKNQWCIFEKSISAEIMRRIEMEKHLRNALYQNELSLVYQPQICCSSRKLKGAEALIRWNSPVYGQVSPTEFIPIAEETGLIIPIGNWVFEEVSRQFKKWNDQYMLNLSVSVNVSVIQLKDKQFLPTVLKILDDNKLTTNFLSIEITESMLVENFITASDTLERLREWGIGIALDDFGTGYSSLNCLKSLPLDLLKIDKSFIDNMRNGNREHSIVGSIINLAHVLDLEVIAEGVETSVQLECLIESHCNIIQGYFFSKPLTGEAFEKTWIHSMA